MTIPFFLNQRYQKILRAAVQHYIATAEPVGSNTLVREYNLSISSATIRNTLGKLEKAGFLYQPHTSAGRIPSDFGYRIYVDNLMIPDHNCTRNIKRKLNQQLDSKVYDCNETFLQKVAQILANLSGYIALITLPQVLPNELHHLQLIQISPKQIMFVVVTNDYKTQSILVDIPSILIHDNKDRLDKKLQIFSNFLNSNLKGKSILDISNSTWQKIDQDFIDYSDFLKGLLKQLKNNLQLSISTQIIIHGVSEILRQPEFSQMKQVKMLIRLLEEEQDKLQSLILDFPESKISNKQVNIRIGNENPLKSMHLYSLIYSTYCQHNVPVGSVGIIGPTRMLYDNTIPLVESTADYLSKMFS
ncbi:MAG: heat-inducible transcription repressor HrcA [Candidatus Atelocyanobacterium thalassa isolate SIO64986]|uniref:Heat-inducible transcription repressor HrcA n=1 Tax=Candidatus Atelocyanobacterium thalassa isolate SIO64986 TaxID=1527444 RepID=A0A086CH61_9CHRO|nr:MAG: heat-inducible transcription repressor HrcA [Candidatus Atelocyanobacterium thalassa isolate SIO64986]